MLIQCSPSVCKLGNMTKAGNRNMEQETISKFHCWQDDDSALPEMDLAGKM